MHTNAGNRPNGADFFFYPNCTQQVFFETFFFLKAEIEIRFLRPEPTHFLSCIELPNRSLLDNWGNLLLRGLTHII